MRPIAPGRPAGYAFLLLLFILAATSYSSAQERPASGGGPKDLGSPIECFCEVTPKVLWRGSKPNKDGAAWLVQNQVGTVVNLELLHDDRAAFGPGASSGGANDDAGAVRQPVAAGSQKQKIGYFRVRDLEVLPVVAPRLLDDHVAHFLAIVGREPKPVYVHCRAGRNRTGVMVAAYRVIVEGADRETAINEMRVFKGFWFGADAAYIRGLTPKRCDRIRRKAAKWLPRLEMAAQIVCDNGACTVWDLAGAARNSVGADAPGLQDGL